ncbi:cAMP-binding domain of CRP or a regulatory subunit of cAMP-dependent protein kinases [bacterium A37T11]|nr:cAMP-binding domain of CRP or a regulatory subunit of cAMP-dependent protein kinases [bacterium A37T11]
MKNFNFQEATQYVYNFWQGHSPLTKSNRDWLNDEFTLLPTLLKNTILYEEGSEDAFGYIVVEGMLAGVSLDDRGNRRIHRIATGSNCMLTTRNLYTDHKIGMDIIALRNTVVLQIPVDALKSSKETIKEVDILTDVWREKRLKQLAVHNALLLKENELERCKAFMLLCKELDGVLTIKERAEYLNVSETTVKRARNPKMAARHQAKRPQPQKRKRKFK